MAAFERNRIDGTTVLSQLRPGNLILRDDEAVLDLYLPMDHDILLVFPAPGESVQAVWIELAADLLTHLTSIDNEVQRISEEQWAGSSHHSSYYEGQLARITLTEGSGAVLRYFVMGCNSEWDERFVRVGGSWIRVADAEPGAAADGGGQDGFSRMVAHPAAGC